MTILACTDYDGPISYVAESSTLTAVDPAHLAKTFTAGATGKVLVRLTGYVFTEPGCEMHFGLIDADDESQVGPVRRVAGGSHDGVVSVALIVRNLTPGHEHTYQWAFSSNVDAQLLVAAGDGWPPAVIEIHALP